MAIILVSGGLDSATALAHHLYTRTDDNHEEDIPISFFYGQRHAIEKQRALDLCLHYNLPTPLNINLAQAFAIIGGSSLTSGLVHGNPSLEQVDRTESELPPSFVPGRNLLMLTVAAAIGYTRRVYTIIGGWNAVDYSGYPDCRDVFFSAFEVVANHALGLTPWPQQPSISVRRPLIDKTKADIIRLGISLHVPYALTYSCYAGGELPCGVCDSCEIRREGFAACGIADPALVTS